MKTLLIFGVETVVGVNIAHTLRRCYSLIGVSADRTPDLDGCQMLAGQAAMACSTELLKDLNVDQVIDTVCCGDSSWNPQTTIGAEEQCEQTLQRAKICGELNIPYTYISSDAVFTSPWMFHEEDSEGHCSSILGQRLRQLEAEISKVCPHALIVRTHPFGWTLSEESGWIDRMLESIHRQSELSDLHQPGFATPIVASELARILDRAWGEGISGIYHIAGAERVNRLQFARRLAELAELGWMNSATFRAQYSESDEKNFACGEMTMQTRKIRSHLCVAMPTLSESMTQLLATRPLTTTLPMPKVKPSHQPVSRAA